MPVVVTPFSPQGIGQTSTRMFPSIHDLSSIVDKELRWAVGCFGQFLRSARSSQRRDAPSAFCVSLRWASGGSSAESPRIRLDIPTGLRWVMAMGQVGVDPALRLPSRFMRLAASCRTGSPTTIIRSPCLVGNPAGGGRLASMGPGIWFEASMLTVILHQ